MASLNKVILLGNVGKDPETRYMPSGEALCTFSMATTEVWKDKQGQKQERTDWHRVEFFGRQAEVAAEYLKKGNPVYIEGRVQYDQWDDKQTGEKKYSTKIKGDRLQLLGGRSGGTNPHPPPSTPSHPSALEQKGSDFDDDIPF